MINSATTFDNNAFLISISFVCIDYARITASTNPLLLYAHIIMKQHVFPLYVYLHTHNLERSYSINLKREWKTSLSVYWSVLKPSYGS